MMHGTTNIKNKFRVLLLSVIDCHNKCDFDRMSSIAQFGGSGKIWWTWLNHGLRILLLKPLNTTAMQRSSKPPMNICCHHRRPREANVFHVLSMVSGKESTINV